jgi:hypothetical protein
MQARAFVAFRHIGESVGGFEGEDFEDLHRRIVQRSEMHSLLAPPLALKSSSPCPTSTA